MTPTSDDCCGQWPAIREQLHWLEFADEPNCFAMVCIPGTLIRVNYCPSCGSNRRMAVWNRNPIKSGAHA